MVRQKVKQVERNNGKEVHDPYEDCPWGKLRCFKKVSNEVKICPTAPCELSAERFGTHERIIDYFIKYNDWGRAYYYLQDLIQPLLFSCNVKDMEEVRKLRREGKKIEMQDYSQGCRIFIISNRIKKLKRDLEEYERKEALHGKENLGEKVKESYFIKQNDFVKQIDASIDILKHLVKDEQYKREQEIFYYRKLGMLYDRAIKARKAGLQVQSGIGEHLEQGFVNAAKGGGLHHKIGKRNREQLKKIDREWEQKQKKQKEGEK